MARFVLVHGSWHGAWCWSEIEARLRAKGHETEAFDLPGHGEDRTPVETVRFQDYVDRTIEAIRAAPEAPILVGHSMGGAIISQAAERVPGCLRALVCLAALVPPDGSSMMQIVEQFDPAYLASIEWSADRRTVWLSPENAGVYFYGQCPPAAVALAVARHKPEPVAPYEAPLALTGANFGSVPRYYIECLRDRAVPIAVQRAMRSAVPFEHILTLDAGHSPFYSMPDELAAILHGIAERA